MDAQDHLCMGSGTSSFLAVICANMQVCSLIFVCIFLRAYESMCVIHGGKKVVEQGRTVQAYTPSLHHKLRQPSPTKPLPKRHWEGTLHRQAKTSRLEQQREEKMGQKRIQTGGDTMSELAENNTMVAPITQGRVQIKTKVLSQQQTLSTRKQMAHMRMLQQQQQPQPQQQQQQQPQHLTEPVHVQAQRLQHAQAGGFSNHAQDIAPRVLQSAESAKAWGEWCNAR